jgi:hypothetical protein
MASAAASRLSGAPPTGPSPPARRSPPPLPSSFRLPFLAAAFFFTLQEPVPPAHARQGVSDQHRARVRREAHRPASCKQRAHLCAMATSRAGRQAWRQGHRSGPHWQPATTHEQHVECHKRHRRGPWLWQACGWQASAGPAGAEHAQPSGRRPGAAGPAGCQLQPAPHLAPPTSFCSSGT